MTRCATARRAARFAAVALLLTGLLHAPAAWGQAATVGCEAGPLQAYAFETITVSTTAVGFTAATRDASTPKMAKVTIRAATIRYRDSGTPTATSGHPTYVGDVLYVCGPSLDTFRMIRQDSTDAAADVTYYKKPGAP